MRIRLEPDRGSPFQPQPLSRFWRSSLDFVLRVGASERPRDICPCARFSGAEQAQFRTVDPAGLTTNEWTIVIGKR